MHVWHGAVLSWVCTCPDGLQHLRSNQPIIEPIHQQPPAVCRRARTAELCTQSRSAHTHPPAPWPLSERCMLREYAMMHYLTWTWSGSRHYGWRSRRCQHRASRCPACSILRPHQTARAITCLVVLIGLQLKVAEKAFPVSH